MLDIDVFIEKTKKKSRLIGIDPGGKRIGIALSDEIKFVATPYTTIIKENYRILVDHIKKFVMEYEIDGIKLFKILLPAVVFVFSVQNKSFTAKGIPGSN